MRKQWRKRESYGGGSALCLVVVTEPSIKFLFCLSMFFCSLLVNSQIKFSIAWLMMLLSVLDVKMA